MFELPRDFRMQVWDVRRNDPGLQFRAQTYMSCDSPMLIAFWNLRITCHPKRSLDYSPHDFGDFSPIGILGHVAP